MTRLIDADALLPMMKYATTDSEIGVFPIKISFNTIAKVIDDAPTIDAEPVVHGEWLPIIEVNEWGEPYQSGVYCSECGETSIYEPKYCPNCGARMDEK